eukprot:5693030-Lingulodinium_polyedra.AAC.1
MVALVDERTLAPMTTIVERKGNDKYSIAVGVRFLDGLGYKKAVLKIDGEPALVDWARGLKKAWSGELMVRPAPRKFKLEGRSGELHPAPGRTDPGAEARLRQE